MLGFELPNMIFMLVSDIDWNVTSYKNHAICFLCFRRFQAISAERVHNSKLGGSKISH